MVIGSSGRGRRMAGRFSGHCNAHSLTTRIRGFLADFQRRWRLRLYGFAVFLTPSPLSANWSQRRQVGNAGNSFRLRGDWRRDSRSTGAGCLSGSSAAEPHLPLNGRIRANLAAPRPGLEPATRRLYQPTQMTALNSEGGQSKRSCRFLFAARVSRNKGKGNPIEHPVGNELKAVSSFPAARL